jgi:hypothetical protein
MIAFVTKFEPCNPFVDLIADMLFGQTSAGAEAAIITKHTATDRDRAVDVGTGKSRVDTDPLDAVPKRSLEVVVVRKIPVPIGSPIEFLALILAGFG